LSLYFLHIFVTSAKV